MAEDWEIFKNKVGKIEHDVSEKYAIYDAKFEILGEDIVDLKKDELKLSDDVSNLQTEHRNARVKINLIDDALQEMNDKIKALESMKTMMFSMEPMVTQMSGNNVYLTVKDIVEKKMTASFFMQLQYVKFTNQLEVVGNKPVG
jgi:chromosome segregation ATPase